MPSPDLLDLATLQNLVDLDDGSYGLLEEMIQIFREDTPPRIAEILEAVHAGDAAGLYRMGHALKGGAGTLGARPLADLAADLEQLGKRGSVDAGPDLAARLEAAFQDCLTALVAYAQAGKG